MLLRVLILSMSFALSPSLHADEGRPFTQAEASHFAALALKGIGKEYPNKMDHVMRDAGDVQSPRMLHPAFYGCFDWHSSVHGHWMLVHLLKVHPGLPEAPAIRAALRANLTKENLAVETAYLTQPGRASFERTYGWAWLLKLAEELHGWDDPDGREWSAGIIPLADAFVAKYLAFLPKQTYPIRTGVHPNTAFGLSFALDYARAVKHAELEKLIVSRARDYFGKDVNYPASWEPGGEEFPVPRAHGGGPHAPGAARAGVPGMVPPVPAGDAARATDTRRGGGPRGPEDRALGRAESFPRRLPVEHRPGDPRKRSPARPSSPPRRSDMPGPPCRM